MIRSLAGLSIGDADAIMIQAKLRSLWLRRYALSIFLACLMCLLGLLLVILPCTQELGDTPFYQRAGYFLFGAVILAIYLNLIRRSLQNPLLGCLFNPEAFSIAPGSVSTEQLQRNDFGSGRHTLLGGQFHDASGQPHNFSEELSTRTWSHIHPKTSLQAKFFVRKSLSPVEPAIPVWILYKQQNPARACMAGLPDPGHLAQFLPKKGLSGFQIALIVIAALIVLSFIDGLMVK